MATRRVYTLWTTGCFTEPSRPPWSCTKRLLTALQQRRESTRRGLILSNRAHV